MWAPRAAPSPFALDARGGAPISWPPFPRGCAPSPSIYREVSFQFRLEFCFTSSFSYSGTRANQRCPRVFRTPPSRDNQIARILFLFVLRLRTGNDLRDQADLASTRSVTTGSWFSDCIGASGSLVVVGS